MSIVVVGDVATDVVVHLAEALNTASDTTATIASYGGGSAANVAAWLAAIGVRTTWVGRLGDDSAGRGQLAELRDAGVDARASIDRTRPTGCVVVLVTTDGERTMLPDRGASAALAPEDLPGDVFTTGRHLHLSGYPLLHESSRAAARAALDLASTGGMTISVDPSSAAPLRALGGEQFLSWTAGVDLCLANLDEARALAGAGPPEVLARRLAAHYGAAVVKLGAAGALWCDGADLLHASAPPVTAIDTTGAGDAFAAGFLSKWVAGAPASAALAEGVRLSAQAVIRPGARPPARLLGD